MLRSTSKPSCSILKILTFIICYSYGFAGSKIQNQHVKKPNIILFFVDDLGWADLGFRNEIFDTPNINKLAESGIEFTQAYIASPTCSPSRATLLTGQHPARLQMVRHIPGGKKNGFDKFDRTDIEFNYLDRDPAQFPSRNWLPLEKTTYAEALSQLGYYNLFIGKWHLGHEKYHPTQQGFDQQIGVSNDGHPKSYYPPYFKRKDLFTDDNNTYLTNKLTNEAIAFIENYKKNQPFMLTFSYYSVHTPHQGRKDLINEYKERGLEDSYANYAAMVKATDESVGKVLQAVKEKGIEKETIILFLSDQGGYFENSPLRGGKMAETLFEGGSRVPFFFYWPGVTTPKTKNPSIVQSTDIFPTLIEIAGGDVSKYENLDGISLMSTIKNGNSLQRGPIYGYRAYEDLYVSVRDNDWKLLAYRNGKIELFNIANDIKESNELSKKHPKKVNELLKELKLWEKQMGVESYSGVQ
ncbi:sulfatase [Leeuwenhoekiella parthenopeia]|uniref:Sulfatase n=1 Tax=Leeuwenhoekiella parthenopeia TaxID=2890320 RepID=A0ABS8GPT9_9FLAO|nr:sulfatase [Leeuwenhoekiella parthenopeia]MCC4212001.1 sulfatase [Leeuwenhoekiella parthenopeia]